MSDQQVIIADVKPRKVELKEGESYFFCACGRSATQPFCDGSHKGTGLSPLKFTSEKTEETWLCCCKQTGNAPFCDGSHKALNADQIGKSIV